MDCFPDAFCRCCECQGIKCFMWHPGHSHRDPQRDPLDLLKKKADDPPKRPDVAEEV